MLWRILHPQQQKVNDYPCFKQSSREIKARIIPVISHPSLPIPLIVRDEHFETEYLMSMYVEAARRHQRIIENPGHLQQAHQWLAAKEKKPVHIMSNCTRQIACCISFS